MCGIKTICEEFGLTPRAVRLYEERGLFQTSRDRFNCRRYDAGARAKLEQIAAYRQAGLSIDDILEIFALDATDPVAQRELVARKLRARIVEMDAARRQAETLLQRLADKVVTLNPEVVATRRAVAGRR